jgi:hypothetical protein
MVRTSVSSGKSDLLTLAYLSNTCWPLACCGGKRDLLRTKRDLLYIGIPEQYLLAPSLL